MRKKFDDIFSRFDTIHERDRQIDTGRQLVPLMHRAANMSKILQGAIVCRSPCIHIHLEPLLFSLKQAVRITTVQVLLVAVVLQLHHSYADRSWSLCD